MTQVLPYQDIFIRYRVLGSGKPVVFLHGYLESLEMWTEVAKELSTHFQLILIDLPGHGQSTLNTDFLTMEAMADTVNAVLKHLNISKFQLFGHSMGGYVSLAYLRKYGEKLNALALVHSSPFSDSDTNKQKRDREINLIKQGKKEWIYRINIPDMFAAHNLENFKPELLDAINTALKTPDNGIIAALQAMKHRPDNSILLREMQIPFLYIAGKYDKHIPEEMVEKIEMPAQHTILRLENSGHMGFVEEKELFLKTVIDFINRNGNTSQSTDI